MTTDIGVMVLAAIVLIMGIALISLASKLKHYSRTLKEAEMVMQRMQGDIRALYAGAAGVGDLIGRIEQQARRVAERQHQLELKDPVSQSYEQAIKLIREGATAEVLISRCGLVRDEAELLVRMYRLEKTG
ncbi:MAG: hypothetical protein FD130_223 [Halothiobacillaceae bacterium]|nr:MAG: hypothetical protein FD130_223 [Halothiobacillaceae bacterium]